MQRLERLHGLTFRSAIAGVGPVASPDQCAVDFTITLENAEEDARELAAPIVAERSDDGATVTLGVRGVARFVVSPEHITVAPMPGVRADVLRLFCRYHAIGVLLRLRGLVVLHGAAVREGDAAHVWVGVSGSGKTSAALEACERGAFFLADEVVALHLGDDGTVSVSRGVPWPRVDGGAPAELFERASRVRMAPDAPVPLRSISLAGAAGAPMERALLAAQVLGGYRPELAPSAEELDRRSKLLRALSTLRD